MVGRGAGGSGLGGHGEFVVVVIGWLSGWMLVVGLAGGPTRDALLD